jgi:hypothetical protein
MLLKIFRAPRPSVINGLRFPSKDDVPTDAFVAFQFLNPHLDGLPFNGPGGAGVLYLWEIYLRAQAGYYVTVWWGNNGTFLWKGAGTAASYVGGHPYPRDGGSGRANGTVHDWELAGVDMDGDGGGDPTHDGDNLITLAGTSKLVVKDRWYLQGLRVVDNGDTTCTATFFIDLPSLANGDIIQCTSAPGFFDTNPPSPAVTWGDSPWAQGERMSSTLRRTKTIANGGFTNAEVVTESADMSRLVLPLAQSDIWHGKTNYTSNDDLACNYGTGRTGAWANANKATLVAT